MMQQRKQNDNRPTSAAAQGMANVSNKVRRLIKDAGVHEADGSGNGGLATLHARAASQMRSYLTMARVRIDDPPMPKLEADVQKLLYLIHHVKEVRRNDDRLAMLTEN